MDAGLEESDGEGRCSIALGAVGLGAGGEVREECGSLGWCAALGDDPCRSGPAGADVVVCELLRALAGERVECLPASAVEDAQSVREPDVAEFVSGQQPRMRGIRLELREYRCGPLGVRGVDED